MNYTSKAVYEYISEKTNDPIVEWKVCEVSGKEFAVYQSDMDFYDKVSPTFDGRKFQIPTPRLCPEERMRRRLLFRNERKLYRRTCDASNKSIISMYSPDKPEVVYDQKIWWWDQWDSTDYSGDLKMLLKTVPAFSVLSVECENSAYANHVLSVKDCYLCYSSLESEDCFYCRWAFNSQDLIDSSFAGRCSNCYELVKCNECHNCFYCMDCYWCSYCSWCEDCEWCTNCFGCKWLRNQQYYIWNKQHTKEGYEEMLECFEDKDKEWKRLLDSLPHTKEWLYMLNSEECIWNNITNCKNCLLVCELSDSQDAKYSFDDWYQTACYDVYWGARSTYCYELMSCGKSTNCAFGAYWIENTNVYYCTRVYYSKDCFMCVWLKNAQYCVLNKQYPDKESYEKAVASLIEKMISEWTRWEYFDPEISAFWYNESIAMDYYPLTKDEALARWYNWTDYEYTISLPENAATLIANKFWIQEWKEMINDDTITNKVIVCEESWKPFRIIKKELDFYRKHWLSLPKKHPDVRHKERIARRPGKVLKMSEDWVLEV